jgi:hypothetical protein
MKTNWPIMNFVGIAGISFIIGGYFTQLEPIIDIGIVFLLVWGFFALMNSIDRWF